MRTLRAKVTFWILFVLIVAGVNTLLGLRAVNEFKRTDRVLEEYYEVALKVRELRAKFFEFHNAGVIATVTRKPEDISRRDARRQELNGEFESNLGPGVSPELREDYERVKERMRSLVDLLPKEGALRPLAGATFLDPEYREHYGAIFESIDRLVNDSARIVRDEREHDKVFHAENMRQTLIVFAFSLFLCLTGTLYFHRRVLRPFQDIIDTAGKLRAGDLSARTSETKAEDEVAILARTLNGLADEICTRREERVRFIGSVAHDLKNPLAAISLNCELGARSRETMGPEVKLRLFAAIQADVSRLRRMADDLLEAAKEGLPVWRLETGEVDLVKLARDTIELYRVTDPGYRFELSCEKEALRVTADRDRIRQVLSNLVSNAAKYSPRGSCVELALGSDDGRAWIEVRDQGLGIPDEKKKAVFDAFTRLEPGMEMAAGSGLGLSIVQEILRNHGATIAVRDNPGGGSIFRITFPLEGEAGQPGLRVESPARSTSDGKRDGRA